MYELLCKIIVILSVRIENITQWELTLLTKKNVCNRNKKEKFEKNYFIFLPKEPTWLCFLFPHGWP